MPVVLLDTNVWVSAFINPHGFPARLRDAWIAGRFDVVVSPALLEEIADVLTRPRIQTKYDLPHFGRLPGAAKCDRLTSVGRFMFSVQNR